MSGRIERVRRRLRWHRISPGVYDADDGSKWQVTHVDFWELSRSENRGGGAGGDDVYQCASLAEAKRLAQECEDEEARP